MNPFLTQARVVLNEYRSREDGSDPAVVTLPASVLPHFHRLAAYSLAASIQVITILHTELWDPESFKNVLWRQVARSGRHVSRLYVLPHAGFAPELLSRQLNLDKDAGVSAGCINLSRLSSDIQSTAIRGLIILDDHAVLLPSEDFDANKPAAHWFVTTREVDVSVAKKNWNQLWALTSSNTSGQPYLDLEEPLVLSADIIHGVAPVLCTSDHIDHENCAWYHGAWQYLRLLNMVSTPTWHDTFYRTYLSANIDNATSRILISGTADYSLLAYVCDAIKVAGIMPTIAVLDLCETPLFACRWYAKRQGLAMEPLSQDIFLQDKLLPESLDLICADAFLTRFSEDEAERILKIWRHLLRPGGAAVTTVRIHESAAPARDTEKLISDFRSRAVQRAIRWKPFIRITPERLGQLSEVYARRMKSVVLGDPDRVRAIFSRAGLRMAYNELASVPGELMPSRYLRIVAQRD